MENVLRATSPALTPASGLEKEVHRSSGWRWENCSASNTTPSSLSSPHYILTLVFLGSCCQLKKRVNWEKLRARCLAQPTQLLWDETWPVFWGTPFSHVSSIQNKAPHAEKGTEGKNELQTGLATDTGLTLGLLKEITERKIKNSNMWAPQNWQLHLIIRCWKSSYVCAGPSPASGVFWIPENSCLSSRRSLSVCKHWLCDSSLYSAVL